MAPLQRILAALCASLLLAGAAGVATHSPHGNGRRGASGRSTASTRRRPTATPSTATSSAPTSSAPTSSTATSSAADTAPPPAMSSTRPGSPPAGSATLASGLITPTDMGGYYRIVPSAGEALLDSAPCLAALQPSPAQGGRAVTALLGPDAHSVPTIVEDVASYAASSARPVYTSVVAALDACSSLSLTFGGVPVTCRTARSGIPPVGDADQVWSGSFSAGGASFTLQLGVVLDGQDVLSLIWIDTVPPSDPVMGSFASTVSLAIGKLA